MNRINQYLTVLVLVSCVLILQTGHNTFAAQPSLTASHLTCEYLSNPQGIDTAKPRLSWQLHALDASLRNQGQSAYQIVVASSQSLLAADRGDMWDSGIVDSPKSVLIEYQGKELRSCQPYFWKVRSRDWNGVMSDWSTPANWSMGILKQEEWKAQWIGNTDVFDEKMGKDNTNPDPWFRKSFDLPEAPVNASIYVASVGYHELYVNGAKITDNVLHPSVSNLRTRARYTTYDIAKFLKPGKNVIGFWLGTSWSIYPEYKTNDKPRTPLVIAQADIALSKHQSLQILTDDSWKTLPSPNTTIGIWKFGQYGGELYDANKEVPNWCQADLDDAAWKPATIYHPKLTLSAEMIEPNRIIKEIHPAAVEKVKDNEYKVDLGVNFAGWFEMNLHGKQGQKVDFQFSERQNEAMMYHLYSAYIIGPDGKGTFKNHFNYFSGRWVTIKGLDYQPALDDIKAYLIHTDYQRAADFTCSNDLLNKIYNTTVWTYESLSLGGYVVDCPQRERMGYGGDAHATTNTALTNFNTGAFYTKWGQDWRDIQDASGNLLYTAPTFWGGGGPGWSGYCITLPWELYHRYGDTRILENSFPTIQRWLAFAETKTKDNMLQRWGGEWDFLGDWLWPGAQGVNGNTRETLFFNNCYWIYNLQTAAKIADILGDVNAAEQYRTRAKQVREKVHKEFFNPADNSYVNGFQAYLALALYVDLPPEDLKAKVEKRLEDEILVVRKGHIHAGITGGAFLFKTLLAENRQDLVFTMATKEDYPSWGDMLKQGATTIWESWEGDISRLHSSYLYIGYWFIEGLGGIKIAPDAAGFQNFVIQPGVFEPKPLNEVHSSYDSLYGKIVSDWKVQDGKFSLKAIVPPNTTAKIYIPAKDSQTIKESSKSLAENKKFRVLKPEGQFTVVEVGSGAYQFESEL